MKVNRVGVNPVAEKMKQLKWDYAQNLLLGNVKKAKKSHREFAKLAVDHFEIATQLPSPINGSVSLFSKVGLRFLKYIIYDIFTKHSPEEKKLKKMTEEYRVKNIRKI
ncbi:hypothetical protein J6R97_08685 [bacterium]|jgi:hypothetical protein|nr:hypothetical protein [bacterium]